MSRKSTIKALLFNLAVTACLLGGILWWLLSGNNPPPGSAANRSTDSGGQTKLLAPKTPAHAGPHEPLEMTAQSSAEDLLLAARVLVDNSPEGAIAWAQSQSDPDFRERLIFAVLRAWGERDPRAAVNWALHQDETVRFINLEAALTGAATQPELALQIGRELLAQDAATGSACGLALVGALATLEKFQEAFQFAGQAPPDSRAGWMAALFQRWGENHPGEAIKALASMNGPERADAFRALVVGWSMGDPSSLAAYALKLPPGDNRSFALNRGLGNWSLQDPAAVGEWLNTLPASPELDDAIARLITGTDSVNRSPETAMSWVESIGDLKQRRDALTHVMQEWAQVDTAAAWRYFRTIPWLDQAERDEIQKTVQKRIQAANSIRDE